MEGKYLILLVFNLCYFTRGNKLFFMLVDGFRWDYFDLPGVQWKGFTRLMKEGVKAEYLIPDFPTNSYPNYRTLETGLHVESHGFIGNHMYDEESGKRFDFAVTENTDKLWFEGSEAFYVTAEKQGWKTALYYVSSTTAKISTSSYFLPYKGLPTRADVRWAIVNGLQRLKNGSADLVYVYYESVDRNGHFYGTNSPELLDAVQEIDELLYGLLNDADDLSLSDSLDVIVVSDHGMADLKPNTVDISAAFKMEDVVEIAEAGSMVYIWPKQGKIRQVYDSLSAFSPHIRIFYKKDIFDRWYLKKHKLIPPLIVVAEPGWYIEHPRSDSVYSGYYDHKFVGNHGFDNAIRDMRAIFLAKGPSFRQGYITKPFSNVNVYQVICHVVGINPRPHNGSWAEVMDLLRDRGGQINVPSHKNHDDL